MTLEVRVSNEVAKQLYRKYGFQNGGIRKRYYGRQSGRWSRNVGEYIMEKIRLYLVLKQVVMKQQ